MPDTKLPDGLWPVARIVRDDMKSAFEVDWQNVPGPNGTLLYRGDHVAAMLAADRAARQAPVVPAGWKLVPMEPTTPMIEAALTTIWNRRTYGTKGRTVGQMQREEWLAMLAAAPASPLQQAQDGERLDWLEKQSRRTCGDNMNPPVVRLEFDYFWPGRLLEKPKTLREAIDAAIQSDAARKEGAKP